MNFHSQWTSIWGVGPGESPGRHLELYLAGVRTGFGYGMQSAMKTFVLLMFMSLSAFGMDKFSALSMIESGDDDFAIGKAGEISRYQILKPIWQSVTNSANYTDSETAREVAAQIMDKRVHTFQELFGRVPSDFEFYALWNAPAEALQGRISGKVAERCHRFANLCQREELAAANPSKPHG